MRTEPIDIPEAIDLLERAMATQGPDFVYNPFNRDCFYEPLQDGDEPKFQEHDPRTVTGCLIGVALDLAGETRHLGFYGSIHELYHRTNGIIDVIPVCTRGAAMVLHHAQRIQDGGGTWGEAVAAAREGVAEATVIEGR